MKVLLFGKKRQTKDGKNFTAYVSKLTRKDGSELTASVKFREECGAPKLEECPCYIEVAKDDANLNKRVFEATAEDGEVKEVESYTLWVTKWKKLPEKYVDHSLDDFAD